MCIVGVKYNKHRREEGSKEYNAKKVFLGLGEWDGYRLEPRHGTSDPVKSLERHDEPRAARAAGFHTNADDL